MTKLDCGHEPSESSVGTGYGLTPSGVGRCYPCAAEYEKRCMVQSGRAVLYDCDDETLSDWTGELRFKVGSRRESFHNMARVRYDVWFRGPDGATWHGYRCGDNTQLTHCRRTKT